MNAAAMPIENQAPVVERVQDALRGSPTSAELHALRAEAAGILRGMQEAEADCRAQSLNPVNTVAEARAARQAAEDFAHESLRLHAAIVTIDQALPVVKAAEHQAAIRPAYEAFRDERAVFIERLRTRWPKLEAEMVELLGGIQRYRQSPGIEIPEGCDPLRGDVEAAARGCNDGFFVNSHNFRQELPQLANGIRLPSFTPRPDSWAWVNGKPSRRD